MSSLDREVLLGEVRRLIPAPIHEETQPDGGLQLIGGDPGEVVVRIIGGKISIALYAVRWEGPHTPSVRPQQLAVLSWRRLPAAATLTALDAIVRGVVELRRSGYRRCVKCGETNPPEWMHGDDICQSCAQRHLGVVY